MVFYSARKCFRSITAALIAGACLGAYGKDVEDKGSVIVEFADRLAESAAAPRGPVTGTAIPVALAIKGGVSLGNYEAGVNWALLRFLKDTIQLPNARALELLAAAGASAGAINGVLSGVYWCQEDSPNDTLEDNMIREAWRSIDIEGLLDHGTGGLADAERIATDPQNNGVFSRTAFTAVQRRIERRIADGPFRPGCRVAFGFSLTRADPVRVDRAGMELPNQRLLVPLRFSVSPAGRLSITNLDDASGDRVYESSAVFLDNPLAEVPGERQVLVDTLFQAIKASSSFPVAFAPIKLNYCLPTRLVGYTPRGTDRRCPTGYRRLTSYFVDGGVFDNDPLGMVRRLAEYGRPGVESGQIRFVNIDPGRRRPPRRFHELNVPQFSQPGDSIPIEMIAGDAYARDPGALREANTQTISLVLCRNGQSSPPLSITLYETGDRSRRFVSSLHTRAARSPGVPRSIGETIDTLSGDELRFVSGDGATAACALPAEAVSRVVPIEPQGLTTQLEFLGGAVDSGRTALLFQEVVGQNWRDGLSRDGEPSDRPLFQTERLTPLVGDLLFAFAGFFDDRFRDFDYFAGVYDASYGLAQTLCVDTVPVSACVNHKFRNIYLSICARDDGDLLATCRDTAPNANAVLLQLVRLDVCGAEAALENRWCPDLDHWQWVADLQAGGEPTDDVRTLLAVGRAIIKSERDTRDGKRSAFVAFIRALAAERDFVAHEGSLLARMLTKVDRPVPTWFYPLTAMAVDQLLPLEATDENIRVKNGFEKNEWSPLAKGFLAVSGMAVETLMADRTGWRPHLSSVPDGQKFLLPAPLWPNELALDMRNGGAGLFWSAGWRAAQKPLGLDLRFSPYVRLHDGGNNIEFSELQAHFVYQTTSPVLSAFGFGPSFSRNWSERPATDRSNLGYSLYAGLFGDKLRFTYGQRAFSSSDFEGPNAYLQLGIRDLGGIAYWLDKLR